MENSKPGAGDVAQLLWCLLCMHEALGWIPSTIKKRKERKGMEEERRGKRGRGQFGLHSEFQATLSY